MLKTILLSLLLGGGLVSSASAQSADEWQVEAELQNLDMLNYGFGLGDADGRFYFQAVFPQDCTILTLKNAGVNEFLQYIDALTRVPGQDSYYEIGYRAGWLTSYLQAYQGFYDSCQDQLDANVKAQMAARRAQCQKLVDAATETATVRPDFASLPKNGLDRVKESELIAMVYLGQDSEAWQEIQRLDRDYILGLPCHAVLVEDLQDWIQTRSQP
jgi:hypothetical protein